MDFLVLEEKIFLKVFAIYSHGGHLGHVTLTINIKFCSHVLWMINMKFGFDWQFQRRRCLNITMIHVYMYLAPGQGQTTSWGQIFFHKHKYSAHLLIPSKNSFLHSNELGT